MTAPLPTRRGPLAGYRGVELVGIGPGPFATTMLADMGATIVSIGRRADAHPSPPPGGPHNPLHRGRSHIELDLKDSADLDVAQTLMAEADFFIEGFRPGVAERLGLDPDTCLARNPGLVYGRMTGWGQSGPYASHAGHDINYIAVAGALEPIGRVGSKPVPPLNLVADFGGGGMLMALGICAALLERERSGKGQVVDAAMVEGAALLTAMLHGMRASGEWQDERGANIVDSGAPFYEVYETSDGKHIALGAIEPQFYDALIGQLGLAEDPLFADQDDRDKWPEMSRRLDAIFRTRTRSDWSEVLGGPNTCFSPVLSPAEAVGDPHNLDRGTFVVLDGLAQPAPAPRLDRTPSEATSASAPGDETTRRTLAAFGLPDGTIDRLTRSENDR